MERFDIESFEPVQLSDRTRIQSFLAGYDDILFCEYGFSNLFIWGNIFKTRWKIQENRLWLFNEYDDLMIMPAGESLSPTELVQASDWLRESGKSGTFVMADEEFVAQYPELEKHFFISADPDNADYIYLIQKLVQLKGKKLIKKRNQVSQFRHLYPHYVCQPLQPCDLDRCLHLADKWCRLRNCERQGFHHESGAIRRALEYFQPLALQGLKIMLEDELAAFTIFSPLNANTIDIHFEKFDPTIKGVAQTINWETAKFLEETFKYCNREQDMGIAGLRQSKRSYDPECILTPYTLIRKS